MDENREALYKEIEGMINAGNFSDAQAKLDGFDERDAEWHYVQAMLYHRKKWMNECQKQLEIAKSMNPDEPKYASAYEKLMSNKTAKHNHGDNGNNANTNANAGNNQSFNGMNTNDDRQMGSDGCNDACTCCQAAICADCLSSCLCGGCR